MRRSRHSPEPREMLSLVQGVYEGDRVPLNSSKANAVTLYGFFEFTALGLTDEIITAPHRIILCGVLVSATLQNCNVA